MRPAHMAPELADLWDELQRGRIYEAAIWSRTHVIDGVQDGETIYIDPRPAVIEILIHELLHRRKPRWSERRVDREAKRLIHRMTAPEMRAWWQRYNQIKRRRRPITLEDE